jgi:uncharacterized membrane protein YkvA (DUF1232 family)
MPTTLPWHDQFVQALGTNHIPYFVLHKMKNTFLAIAFAQAIRMAGKPARLLQLVAQVAHRLSKMDRKSISTTKLKEKLCVLGRLVAAYARGHYRVVPLKTMATIVTAVLYFLNPFDLVPDAILGIGLMDDLAVLTWVYRNAREEVTKFRLWEKMPNEIAVSGSVRLL